MDTQLSPKIYESLTLLIGKVSQLESNQESFKEILQEKLNPTRKEFIDDEDLLQMFGITINVKYKMLKSGALKAYKLNGKGSKNLYKYDEVVASIEGGLVYKKR